MQRAPLIVNKRLKRRINNQHSPTGSAGLGCSLLTSLMVLGTILLGAVFYTQITRGLPSPLSLPLLVEPPNGILLQPTLLFDRSGQHVILSLENLAGKDHRYLKVDPSQAGKTAAGTAAPVQGPSAGQDSFSGSAYFPANLIKATLAVADPTFWTNPGFISEKWNSPVPVTIAERLVSTLLLADEKPGLIHNVRLRLISAQITARYGRVKVLEWYLNTAQYGPLVYGADAAARVYFHKPAGELTLAETAALAAIAEAPQLNPFDAPQITTEARQQVIHAMLSQGLISSEEAVQATQSRLNLAQPASPAAGLAPAFTNLVLQQLAEQLGQDRLERGGLHIRTSLDYDLQLQVNCAVKAQLERSTGTEGQSQDTLGADCPAARLLPTLPDSSQALTTTLTTEVVVYDPQSGQILAQAGNASQSSLHPAGSLLTPFIYLTSFTRGLSPASLVWDIPGSTPAGDQGSTAGSTPESGGTASRLAQVYHGPVRIRTAFANDYLAPAAQLLSQIGPENVALTAQQLGVSDLDTESLQAFSNSPSPSERGNVSLLEMASAYAAFANGGVRTGTSHADQPDSSASSSLQPVIILNIETANGNLLQSCLAPVLDCSLQSIPALSPQLAYLVTNVLSDETARWPAYGHPNPLEIGRPAGAKIGQVPDGGAGSGTAWTIGFTPQLLVGVWVGPAIETPSASPGNKAAAGASAALWHAIIQYASRNLPANAWTAPAGIQTVQVCDPSGMLPTSTCPTVVNEVFISGNEPTQTDNLYQVFHINRETGRLATVFTPPELVEDRIYMVVPPQASEWARSTNLPIPPDNYDVIYTPPTIPAAVITSPEMFANIAGKIEIRGTADGDGFSFYRLQVGKGLNPTEWVQVGKDNPNPVKDGVLGQWDTSGLDGLFALQLQVVLKDQRLETCVVQLTLDSQPPQVTILHPQPDQTVKLRDNAVVLQANASDNLALARLEYYIDNQLIGTLYQAPFTLSWQVKPGVHKFMVKAFDLANNSSQDSVTFTAGN